MSRKNKGLTLVEVMVVVAVMGILVGSLYTVFKAGADAWSKSDMRLEIYQNARVALGQIARELPGALVGGGATFVGENGGVINGEFPDTLMFVTNFANSIYKVRYSISGNMLKREYSENPEDLTLDPTKSIDFIGTSDAVDVADLQFFYLALDSSGGWGTVDEKNRWSGPLRIITLPEAVKTVLTLQDREGHQYDFEIITYIPGSE